MPVNVHIGVSGYLPTSVCVLVACVLVFFVCLFVCIAKE